MSSRPAPSPAFSRQPDLSALRAGLLPLLPAAHGQCGDLAGPDPELGLSAADLGLLTSTYFFAFGLAQIPVGIALDRYGPRRVEAALLLLTAIGGVLFATGESLPTLASARGLIGMGVAACLMAGLKGFTLWYPREKLASMTGYIMSCGALGAVTASAPLEAALPFLGWRGAFWLVAALAAGVAALIFFSMPEKDESHDNRATCSSALRGVGEVLTAGTFLELCGPVGLFHRRLHGAAGPVGGALADGGQWLQPRWRRITCSGSTSACWPASSRSAPGPCRLAARGITPLRLMQVGLFLSMVVEGLIIAETGSTLALWCVLGARVGHRRPDVRGHERACSPPTSPAGSRPAST
jgi:MFS family permease